MVIGWLGGATAGCALDPPPGNGLFAYSEGEPAALVRVPAQLVKPELLSAGVLQKTPRIKSLKALVSKDGTPQSGVSVGWSVTGGGNDIHPGVAETLKKDALARQWKFADPPAAGWVLVRLKGSPLGGWYPVIIGDSAAWALREGRSWARLNDWVRAGAAFRRAIDLDETAEALRLLGTSLIRVKNYPEALAIANRAWDKAVDQKIELVSYGSLLGEAHMMNGDYQEGLKVFDRLKSQYPTDGRWQQELGRLLEGVDPSPEELVSQLYTAAGREGADGVEPFVLERDLEQKGEAALKRFTSELIKFGRVTTLTTTQTQRFGRVAFVKYQVRFSDGTKFDRKMTFFLDDSGHYKARMD